MEFDWQMGKIAVINGVRFIPLRQVECVKYNNQQNDEFDLIRVGEVYPVILIIDKDEFSPERYLIINRKGYKQYCDSSYFKTL